MINTINEIIAYKEMLKSLVKKDLRTRYKGSFFGFLWTFINPVLQVVVYSIIFPYIMRSSESNYTMFLFVAMLPWNYFTSALQGSCGLIVYNSSLVTKLYFPREILPIASSIAGFFNMLFAYMIVVPLLLLFNIPITWNILWLPVLFIIQIMICTGFTLIISAINVYFRDVEHMLSIILMAMYFLTPIMYSIDMLPENLQPLVLLNPMAGLVISYRDVLFYGKAIDINMLIYPVVFSISIFIIGFLIFDKLKRNFAEVL